MGRINMTLMDQVIDHIEENLDDWEQGHWAAVRFDVDMLDKLGIKGAKVLLAEDPFNPICGTTGCFAGHAAVSFGGYKFDTRNLSEWRLREGDVISLDGVIPKDAGKGYMGHPESVRTVAMRLLNLDNSEAQILFEGGNSIEQLRDMVEFMREHDELPHDWDDDDRGREQHVCDCPHCEIDFEDEA